MRSTLIFFALTACSSTRVEPASRRAPASASQAHVSAPAQVTLESLEVIPLTATSAARTGAPAPSAPALTVTTEAHLLARVILHASADLPVTVTLSLPPGASLRAGRVRFTLPSIRPGVVVEERYTIAYAAAPTAPVVLQAHAAGEDFGFHAEARWAFDRVEVAPARATADGARLVLGRHDFGPSVRVRR